MNLINCASYLFTINEAARLMRMNRQKFLKEYIKSGRIRLTILEDGRYMILHSELQNYLEEKTFNKIGE